jgi:hypothetical protein
MYFNPAGSLVAGQSVVTLRQWLSDAQTALAALMTGRREVVVAYDGKSVTYSAANRSDLEAWISLLQQQLGLNKGRRALRVYFR